MENNSLISRVPDISFIQRKWQHGKEAHADFYCQYPPPAQFPVVSPVRRSAAGTPQAPRPSSRLRPLSDAARLSTPSQLRPTNQKQSMPTGINTWCYGVAVGMKQHGTILPALWTRGRQEYHLLRDDREGVRGLDA